VAAEFQHENMLQPEFLRGRSQQVASSFFSTVVFSVKQSKIVVFMKKHLWQCHTFVKPHTVDVV